MDNLETSDAGWATWPNLVTLVRLALLPVFVVLAFNTDHRAASAWLLALLGATDWVDGFLARRFNQVSNVGKILDPVADRLLVSTSVISVAMLGAVPWWFAVATFSREVLVSALTLALAALGAARIDVLWWGKVSTFALMAAYPLFLLCSNPHDAPLVDWQVGLQVLTWAIGIFGLVLAWAVLAGYVKPALAALRTGRAARKH